MWLIILIGLGIGSVIFVIWLYCSLLKTLETCAQMLVDRNAVSKNLK